MKDISVFLSANIRNRRKELHLTQLQLAEKLGYSEKAISKWESGKGVPPTTILPALAKHLEISLDALMHEPTEQRLFLGIDGGGTKTEFVLADSNGAVLSQLILGSSNPNDIGMNATKKLLQSGIYKVCGDHPLSSISLFAGLAGGGTAGNSEKLREFLSGFGFAKAACGSDARNAVAAGLGNSDGIAVIMGTGSIVYAQQDGKQYRLGGYGYLLGDAGSGFALGRDVIAAALRHEDGSGPQTKLCELVKTQCNGKTVLEKLGEFYEGGKVLIASYAPLLFQACAKGDHVANTILRSQLQEIADLIASASKQIKNEPVSVVLCGGLASANRQFILPVLQDILKNRPRAYTVSICDRSVADGALYLAGMPASKGEASC